MANFIDLLTPAQRANLKGIRQAELQENILAIFNQEVVRELVLEVEPTATDEKIQAIYKLCGNNPWNAHIVHSMFDTFVAGKLRTEIDRLAITKYRTRPEVNLIYNACMVTHPCGLEFKAGHLGTYGENLKDALQAAERELERRIRKGDL